MDKAGTLSQTELILQKKIECLPVDVSHNVFHGTSFALKPNVKEDVSSLVQVENVLPHFIEHLLICFLGEVWQQVRKLFQDNLFPVLYLHDGVGMLLFGLDVRENVFTFFSHWKLKWRTIKLYIIKINERSSCAAVVVKAKIDKCKQC